MRLQEIKLVNFRKHLDLTFAPGEGINLIYGQNGSGKTNILEAVHYCSLSRGLNRSLDKECLNFSADYFLLKSRFLDDRDIELSVKVSYSGKTDKKIVVNGEELNKFSQLIGRVPCITFSPAELVVVTGSPQERRRFVDNALSQTDKRYLEDLLQYRRVVQQRNSLLSMMHDEGLDRDSLAVWSEKLSLLAASIMTVRTEFLFILLEYFRPLYENFGLDEIPGFSYRSTIGKFGPDVSGEEIIETMMHRFRDIETQELIRKQTLIGPHRDDIMFQLNNVEVKKYASQGQLRTFFIALKLALHKYVLEVTGERPLFLLDDLFSELDRKRAESVIQQLESSGQSIITSTERLQMETLHATSINDMITT